MTVVFGQRANAYIHLDNCLCSRKDNADMPVSIVPFLDVPLYIIGVLNTQRFGAFVSNIGEFGG